MLTTVQEITLSSSKESLGPHFSHFHPLDGEPNPHPFFNEASSVVFRARKILRGPSLPEIVELADEISFRIDCFVDDKEYLDHLGYSHQWINEYEKAWFDNEGNCFSDDEVYDLRDVFKSTEILDLVHYVNSPFQDSHLFAVLALMKLNCMKKWVERDRDDKSYAWLGIGETLFEAQEAISQSEYRSYIERSLQQDTKEYIEETIQARINEKLRLRAVKGAYKKNERYRHVKKECQSYYRSKPWPSRNCAAHHIRENIINNPSKWPVTNLKQIPTVKTIYKWLKDGESI